MTLVVHEADGELQGLLDLEPYPVSPLTLMEAHLEGHSLVFTSVRVADLTAEVLRSTPGFESLGLFIALFAQTRNSSVGIVEADTPEQATYAWVPRENISATKAVEKLVDRPRLSAEVAARLLVWSANTYGGCPPPLGPRPAPFEKTLPPYLILDAS